MVIVRKKQSTMRRAMTIRKMKLEVVSKPSQLARAAIGSGKMAMMTKTIGRSSQATELLMDIEFLLRQMIIRISKMRAAITISA